MNERTTKGTYKKVDLSVNGDKTSLAVAAQKKREEKLFPLRLNSKTVIYVKKNRIKIRITLKKRKRKWGYYEKSSN